VALLEEVLTIGLVVIILCTILGYFGWIAFYTPPGDNLRIKAHFPEPAQKVVGVERYAMSVGGRYGPYYRTYWTSLENPLGHSERRLVGVEATLFGYPSIRDFGQRGY